MIGVDLPPLGDLVCVGVEEMSGVDALELAERRQQSHSDVDGAVADREDPPIARHRVAVAILDVERRLDPRFGVARCSPSTCGSRCRTGHSRVRNVPSARPNRLFAPSATTT
jgi:hypothetical protein